MKKENAKWLYHDSKRLLLFVAVPLATLWPTFSTCFTSSAMTRTFPPTTAMVVFCDVNAKVGSEKSAAIGAADCEQEDLPGLLLLKEALRPCPTIDILRWWPSGGYT